MGCGRVGQASWYDRCFLAYSDYPFVFCTHRKRETDQYRSTALHSVHFDMSTDYGQIGDRQDLTSRRGKHVYSTIQFALLGSVRIRFRATSFQTIVLCSILFSVSDFYLENNLRETLNSLDVPRVLPKHPQSSLATLRSTPRPQQVAYMTVAIIAGQPELASGDTSISDVAV